MNYYKLIKPLLFKIDPETTHHGITTLLKWVSQIWGIKNVVKKSFQVDNPSLERKIFGLKFKNPVGLAAGFDKNGNFLEELAQFGFGFIEVGTVTPLPQSGHSRPRLFRLPLDTAIINRMGFNNQGVDVVADRLRRIKRNDLIIGGNIGKNKFTSNEDAIKDYLLCFDRLFDVVDYFVINVSSPNTAGLRDLQEKEPLTHLLTTLQQRNAKRPIPRPILLKIAPDLTDVQLDSIIDIVKKTQIAGVIATNTSISRDNLISDSHLTSQIGGLSGKPIKSRSTEIIHYLATKSNKAFVIIGVGGIHSPADALEKMEAGASLIQLYTGLIYEGPSLVKQILIKLE